MNRRLFIALSGLLFLAGCGFQLRGTDDYMGQLPKALRIEATDPFSSIVQKVTQEFSQRGIQIVSESSALVLKLTLPKASKRVLGPVSDSEDQTELALEMSFSVFGENRISLVPETEVRVSLVYIDSGSATSAENQSVAQLKKSLEEDLVQQVVNSVSLRYEQAIKHRSKIN
jgi:outer membrane lipopolysaccharide assembly protein LptE/RlpB